MRIIFIIVLAFFLIAIGLRSFERRNLYFPLKKIEVTPAQINLKYQEETFETLDHQKLNCWFIPKEGARWTVLFCHGNGGNISHRLEKIKILHELGLQVFIFDYRGYGKSTGSPNERGLYKDAVAAYNYLVKYLNVPQNQIILYGESLGGAVAVDLATKKNVGGLIIEDTFTSVPQMAKIHYPAIPTFLISTQFDSLAKVGKPRVPKLFIHSVDDEIIPYSMGERLFAAASEPKQFIKIHGDHNGAFFQSKTVYRGGLDLFLKSLR